MVPPLCIHVWLVKDNSAIFLVMFFHLKNQVMKLCFVAAERETANFLQKLGFQDTVVQKIMKRHGVEAHDKVLKDPYYALRNIPGINLR